MLAPRRSSAPRGLLTPGFWLLTSTLPTNEAGMLLIWKGIRIYLGASRKRRKDWNVVMPPRSQVTVTIVKVQQSTSYNWQSSGYTCSGERNRVAGRNVKKNEQLGRLCSLSRQRKSGFLRDFTVIRDRSVALQLPGKARKQTSLQPSVLSYSIGACRPLLLNPPSLRRRKPAG
jgi:hypothetical protein